MKTSSLGRRIRMWVKPRKIHKLKLTNSFRELAAALLKIFFWKLRRAQRTEELEEAFRKRFKTTRAIVFPHARTALYFILKSLNLEKGSEVLMAPLTIVDMINSIHALGLKPVFVDIELETFCIDLKQIEKAITPKSKVLFVTYLFGIVPDMEKMKEIAGKYDLRIIEDCSQCFDAFYNGQPIGTFGEAAIFSLTNFKVCSSLFGGMVVTNNEKMAELLADFRNREILAPRSAILLRHIIKNLIYTILFSKWIFSYFTYFIVVALETLNPEIIYRLYSGNIRVLLGMNEIKLLSEFPPDYLVDYTEIQAYVGLCSFSKADEATSKRISNGELLRQLLAEFPGVLVPSKRDGVINVYWRFPILSNDLDGLKRYLLLHGIDSAPTYLALCSREPGFGPYHRGTPNAERFKKGALIVEINEDLTEGDVYYMATLVREYFSA